jgi:hypothetical protein
MYRGRTDAQGIAIAVVNSVMQVLMVKYLKRQRSEAAGGDAEYVFGIY